MIMWIILWPYRSIVLDEDVCGSTSATAISDNSIREELQSVRSGKIFETFQFERERGLAWRWRRLVFFFFFLPFLFLFISKLLCLLFFRLKLTGRLKRIGKREIYDSIN